VEQIAENLVLSQPAAAPTAPASPSRNPKRLKVTVDQDKCCGAGQCVVLAPDVFDQREQDGIVVLLDATPAESLHADVREAASVCPAAAITLDESGDEGDAS
jgi:ferredoxin